VLIALAKATGFIAFSLLVGLRVVPRFMAHVTRLRSSELFIVTAAVFALGAAAVCTLLGLSAALGAFVAGLVLSESEFDHRVIAEVVPIRDLFATLFFVSVGMLVDVSFIVAHWQVVLAAAALVIVLKSLATLLGVLPFRLTPRTAAFTALGMIPVGELNFVLAQTGLQANALSAASYKLILTSALVTIVLTPLAFKVAPAVGDFLARTPGLRRRFDSYSNVGASGTLEAHALVIGYGRVGHAIAEGLRRAGMSVVVIDSRLSRVREAGTSDCFAVYGNASSRTVLSAAHVENARLVVVALTDHGPALAAIQQVRAMNSEVLITARAEYAVHEAALHDAGANVVIVPELEGATALLNTTLDALGLPR
jgi:CPA2 family monovalent cation:H+ antiporter-2